MNSIDKNLDLQGLLAELKQLEQDLLEATNTEFPELNNNAYFKGIFAEINNNTETINNLIEQNREAEQDYLLVTQEEKELEQSKKQLYGQLSDQK